MGDEFGKMQLIRFSAVIEYLGLKLRCMALLDIGVGDKISWIRHPNFGISKNGTNNFERSGTNKLIFGI